MCEYFSDTEDYPSEGRTSKAFYQNLVSSSSVDSSPKLGFRVWSPHTSKTTFTEEDGFKSQMFTLWKGKLPPPFQLEGQGKQAIDILLNIHFCMSGGASAWISVSTSLLQALVKACSMEQPRLALIDLGHPLLGGAKTLSAYDQLRELKRQGQAYWARYKGCSGNLLFESHSI
ncbi:hypothetical protein GQ44DRAFT_612716 [Phaeosphaeriaceae sp. PMI808]|nr:hypothetical protein GQ44DRAFT_612716 [Phaeosphaeriaceae sp. PMI808]